MFTADGPGGASAGVSTPAAVSVLNSNDDDNAKLPLPGLPAAAFLGVLRATPMSRPAASKTALPALPEPRALVICIRPGSPTWRRNTRPGPTAGQTGSRLSASGYPITKHKLPAAG